jgi:sortase A
MRRKSLTLAVAVLVLLPSVLAVTGPTLARAFSPTWISAGEAMVRTPTVSVPADQPVARLPHTGQDGSQPTAPVNLEPTHAVAPTQPAVPSPTARPTQSEPTATASAVPSPTAPAVSSVTVSPAVLSDEVRVRQALSTIASLAISQVTPTKAPASTATTEPKTAPVPIQRVPTPVPPAATAVPAPQVSLPDRIVAPAIGLDSKIIPVGWTETTNADGSKSSEWAVAEYAVSWHKTSAKLGEAGNTVLTGHNNIKGEVFRYLEDFRIGDQITIYSGQKAFQYTVTDKFIVQEEGVPYAQRLENAKWIGEFPDERITLMSCHPYSGSQHRIFIIAQPSAKG